MTRPPLCKLLAFQLGCCLTLCALSGVKGGFAAAQSAGLGGLAIVLANGFFFWRLFAVELGADSGRVLGNYYRAEANKLLVVVAMLATVMTIDRHDNKPDWFVVDTAAMFFGFLLQSLLVTVSNTVFIARWLGREFPDTGNPPQR